MKKFVLSCLAFGILIGTTIFFLYWRADQIDAYYNRFTTPAQHSLVLGSSRAAQGIQPQVLKEVLARDIYNYAFTLNHSPYGLTYLESIRKKLVPEDTNGVFIVTVDPWSISSRCADPNDMHSFRELNFCLASNHAVDKKPNIPYLLKYARSKRYVALFNWSPVVLHHDGWLEVNIKMDPESVGQRTWDKIKMYEEKMLPHFNFSTCRLDYLEKTVDLISRHGKVYLVRMPIHPGIMEIEDQFLPNFETKIRRIINKSEGYLDMTKVNSRFTYTDGNHLHKDSGEKVSRIIAEWISQLEQQTTSSYWGN